MTQIAQLKELLSQRIAYADTRMVLAVEDSDEITASRFFGEWRAYRGALQWINEIVECPQEMVSIRSDLTMVAAACARLQHARVEDLEQHDLEPFGYYANKLRDAAKRFDVR